jgi:hypothetical protein
LIAMTALMAYKVALGKHYYFFALQRWKHSKLFKREVTCSLWEAVLISGMGL